MSARPSNHPPEAPAISLAYLSALFTFAILAEMVVAALAVWVLAAWLNWQSATIYSAWVGAVLLGLTLTIRIAIREIRRAGRVFTGTTGYHLLSICMALVFAGVGSGQSPDDPYLLEFFFVGRIMVEILILLFFLSYLLLAVVTRQRLSSLHLLGPVVSLLSIAWLAYKFPA